MKNLRKCAASAVIATTAVLGGLSSNAVEAATLTTSSSFSGINSHKEGPLAKVGLDLSALWAESNGSNALSTPFQWNKALMQMYGDQVVIDAVAASSTEALLSDLQSLGLQNSSTYESFVSGLLPIGAIDKMATLDSLKFSRPAYKPATNVGLVTSQGDVSMKADVARTRFGVDGSGVTVGVLSDSFDALGGAASDVASGDLPTRVNVLKDYSQPGAADEGRAMLQLVHDVAPGSNLAFHTAFLGQADFANGIVRLANKAKSKVIVDDVLYYAEPMFQDGIIAKAVNSVAVKGVSYFSSAGNQGRKSYESAFRPSGMNLGFGELHNFNPGKKVDPFQSITVPVGADFIVSFQWNQPFFSVNPSSGGSSNDLDIYLLDSSLKTILAKSSEDNINGDPVEIFYFLNDGSFGSEKFNLLIANSRGSNPELMKYVAFGNLIIDEFDTASGTAFGHANADGAEAVGAAFYAETPAYGTAPALLEPFSSAGPVPILFDAEGNPLFNPEIRLKPEIVAPDGTNTTFFIPGLDVEGDDFPNFFGTSAAAPHAAAVAALMLDRAPDASSDTIYAALENTALDMDDPSTPGFDTGFDFASGNGLIQADLAVQAVPEPASVLATLALGVFGAGSLWQRRKKKTA